MTSPTVPDYSKISKSVSIQTLKLLLLRSRLTVVTESVINNIYIISFFLLVSRHLQGYQVAYVVFKDEASLQQATKMPYSRDRFLSTDYVPFATGLKSK